MEVNEALKDNAVQIPALACLRRKSYAFTLKIKCNALL